MLEIKVVIEAPELTGALNNLAESIKGITIVDEAPCTCTGEAPAQTLTFMPEDVQKVEAPTQAAPVAPVVPPQPQVAPVPAQATNPMPAPTQPPVQPPVAPQTAQAPVTRNDVQTAVIQLVQAQKISLPKITEILGKYGAAGIPQLADEYLAAFAADLQAAVAQ